MKFNVLTYLLIILFFVSCDSLRQEVEPKGIVQEPQKLVVACFISPQDTVLAARVTYSLPVLGTGSQNNSDVPNATVRLSDGDRFVLLQPEKITDAWLYGGSYTLYRANPDEFPIIAGKSYTLIVQVPDGRQVKAICKVPGSVPLQQVIIDSAITTEFGDRRKSYYARLRWRDPSGATNFYRVAGNNEYAQRRLISTSPNGSGPFRDTVVYYRGDWFFERGTTITDAGRDGEEITSTRGRLSPFSYTLVNGIWLATPPSGQLQAYLLNVEENYYRYHDEVERQNQSRDNPFAEPVPISTNIQGGLGCFGAYNRSSLTLYIK
ncbi:DUF4249 domain-containing protein [Spirosoma sp.]|uniref:DUF4249 domain-containing protein n=1 Tax=Spirosoma sp. TaxID=1899569 RepID=UPI003B3BD2F9